MLALRWSPKYTKTNVRIFQAPADQIHLLCATQTGDSALMIAVSGSCDIEFLLLLLDGNMRHGGADVHAKNQVAPRAHTRTHALTEHNTCHIPTHADTHAPLPPQ